MTTYKYNIDGSTDNTNRRERYTIEEMKSESQQGIHIHSVVKLMNNKIGIGIVVKQVTKKKTEIIFTKSISRYVREKIKKNNAIIYGLWTGIRFVEQETDISQPIYLHYPERNATVKRQIQNGGVPKWVKQKTVAGYSRGSFHIREFSNGGQKASILATDGYEEAYGGDVPDWKEEKPAINCEP